MLVGDTDTGKTNFIRQFLLPAFRIYVMKIAQDKYKPTMPDGSSIEKHADVFGFEEMNSIPTDELCEKLNLLIGGAKPGFPVHIRVFQGDVAIERPVPVVVSCNVNPTEWFKGGNVTKSLKKAVLSRLVVIDCNAIATSNVAPRIPDEFGNILTVIAPFQVPRPDVELEDITNWFQFFWAFLVHENKWDFSSKEYQIHRRSELFDKDSQ